MSKVHRRILDRSLGALEEEQATYFNDVAERLDEDPRTERFPNLVYLVLSDAVIYLPIYIGKKELINRLFRFVDQNYGRLRKVIYDPAFLENKTLLRPISGDFVAEIIEATLIQYEKGDIDTGETEVHRISFDENGAREGDFPYIDDEEEDAL